MGERQGQHELHSKSKKRDSLTRPGAATITSVGGVIRQFLVVITLLHQCQTITYHGLHFPSIRSTLFTAKSLLQ